MRTDKDHHRENKDHKEGREPMGRPRAGSESSRNPVSKVMDLIRHRSHSTLSAEDKRKAVSNLILYYLHFLMLNRSKNIMLPQIRNSMIIVCVVTDIVFKTDVYFIIMILTVDRLEKTRSQMKYLMIHKHNYKINISKHNPHSFDEEYKK